MKTLLCSVVVALLLTSAGCGPSKSEQAKAHAQSEIKQSNAEHGEAIRARCTQLGAAAALLQEPQVTAAVPANTNFGIYPEFYNGGPWAESAKMAIAGPTHYVAVVCWKPARPGPS